MTYSEKLRDPRWQKKRLEILQRDNFACTSCGETTKTLHIHHSIYIFGFNPWEYADNDMNTLCENCHKKEHDLSPEIELERKYEHLIAKKEIPQVILAINAQISELNEKLKDKLEQSVIDDILMNIMFLQDKRKELYG